MRSCATRRSTFVRPDTTPIRALACATPVNCSVLSLISVTERCDDARRSFSGRGECSDQQRHCEPDRCASGNSRCSLWFVSVVHCVSLRRGGVRLSAPALRVRCSLRRALFLHCRRYVNELLSSNRQRENIVKNIVNRRRFVDRHHRVAIWQSRARRTHIVCVCVCVCV